MSNKLFQNLIAGEWRDGETTVPNTDPWTGAKLGDSAQASRKDLEDATVAAVSAAEATKRRPTWKRAEILERAAAELSLRKNELVAVMNGELGRPSPLNAVEVDRGIFTLKNAAEEARRLNGEYLPLDLMPATESRYAWWKREPVGPVIGITPFNFPVNLMLHKIAPAIAAGCPITIKLPPQTPSVGRLVGECFVEAGVIPGELNLLDMPPEVATVAVEDDRYKLLSFTGSPRVGWVLKAKAGKKRVILELGNSSGVIVHNDIQDMHWVAKRLAFGSFAAAGQVCISVQRIFVQSGMWSAFTGEFLDQCRKLEPVQASDPTGVLGPMVDDQSADRVWDWVHQAIDAGAESLLPLKREGRRIWPIVLTNVEPTMKVFCEEVFGPVVVLERYNDVNAAVSLLNATPFGLQAGVFTDSLEVMHRVIDGADVAAVMINEFPTFRIDHMPYGGIKDSGLGREGVRFALEEYTEKKLVVVNKSPRG